MLGSSLFLALLVTGAATAAPTPSPNRDEAAALGRSFAAALARDDRAALDRIAAGGRADEQTWRTALGLIASHDDFHLAAVSLRRLAMHGDEASLDLQLDGTAVTAGGRREVRPLPRFWHLTAVRVGEGWVLSTAAIEERRLAEELATADAAAIEAAVAAAPAIDWDRFEYELADCAGDAGDAGASALAWALASARRRGSLGAESSVLQMASYAELIAQRLDTGMQMSRDALALAERAHDADETASSLFSIGVAYWMREELDDAVATMRRATEDIDSLADPATAMRSLYMAGLLEMKRGRPRSAAEIVGELERHLEKYPRPRAAMDASFLLAHVQMELGSADVAMRAWERVRELARQQGDRTAEEQAVFDLAFVKGEGGDPAAARDLLAAAVAEPGALRPKEAPFFYAELAGYQQALGELADADRTLGQALELARAAGEQHVVQEVLGRQSSLRLAQGRPAEALALAQQATETLPTPSPSDLFLPLSPWRARAALGAALRATGRAGEAETALRAAIALLEEGQWESQGDPVVAAASSAEGAEAYRALIDLLVDGGRAREALVTADRMRARRLLDTLERGRVDLSSALDGDERRRETELDERIAAINRSLFDAADAATVERLTRERDEARLALQRFRTDLYAAHPRFARRRGGVDLAAADDPAAVWQQAVPAGVVVVEWVLAADHALAFLVSRRPGPPDGRLDVEVRRLAVGEKQLAMRIEALAAAVARRDPAFAATADELHSLLVAPLADRLHEARSVCIIPDGILWRLPFQVLRDRRGRFLVERTAVFRAPSLAALALARSADRSAAREPRLLALGNPEAPAAGVAPLPDAEAEVRAVGRLYGSGRSTLLVGAAASERAFKERAAGFDVIHLATHARLDDAAPLFSSLVLAALPNDREDGLLEAREIAELELSGRLVVLSACETGAGRVRPGEGLVGMSWALLAAGAPTAVVSSWKADSAATTMLMVELHRRLLAGDAPAVALQHAQLALQRDPRYRHPYYWATFGVLGNGW